LLQLGPWLTRTDECRREDDCVESDVIFSHKLVELNILFVLPPFLPLIIIICSDRNVADRRIEPHIEHLVGQFLERDWRAPLEVSCDHSFLESSVKEVLSERPRVLRPVWRNLGHELFKLRLDLWQVDEDVLSLLDGWCGTASAALGVNKLKCVEQLRASIALITFGISTAAEVAGTFDESVCKERVTLWTELLIDHLLGCHTLLVQVHEDVLRDLGLLGGCCTSELVEVAVEPFVDFGVKSVVVVANLLWSLSFLTSLSLGCGTVLICATNVEDVVAGKSGVSRVHIC